jgi:hypothetical protein
MEMEKERGNSVKSMEFILDWNECLKANDLELMES